MRNNEIRKTKKIRTAQVARGQNDYDREHVTTLSFHPIATLGENASVSNRRREQSDVATKPDRKFSVKKKEHHRQTKMDYRGLLLLVLLGYADFSKATAEAIGGEPDALDDHTETDQLTDSGTSEFLDGGISPFQS